MMSQVVKEGTGTAAALQGIDVAGKTGTAEVGRPCGHQPAVVHRLRARPGTRRSPSPSPSSAASGFGGTVAAPIAKAVMQALLK